MRYSRLIEFPIEFLPGSSVSGESQPKALAGIGPGLKLRHPASASGLHRSRSEAQTHAKGARPRDSQLLKAAMASEAERAPAVQPAATPLEPEAKRVKWDQLQSLCTWRSQGLLNSSECNSPKKDLLGLE